MTDRTTYYIGDISHTLGLSQRAIRYYEELGIIKPTRTEGGFRTYSARDIDLLKMVLKFKELGMSLEEIQSLLCPKGGELNAAHTRELRDALMSKREELKNRMRSYEEGIAQIDRVLEILSGCATCGKPSNGDTCGPCLKERGDDSSPILGTLIQQGPGPEKER